MVDGVHNTEPLNAFISITPPLDSIEAFTVETSNPNAEYGSFGGAIVNLTIKSGTNAFHGEAFDFLRNDVLNARDFFAQTRSPYKSNQFGGTFGGPIIKSKLFFFVAITSSCSASGSKPTSSPCRPRCNGRAFSPKVASFRFSIRAPGSRLPAILFPPNRIDPVAQKVANLFPAAESSGPVEQLRRQHGEHRERSARGHQDRLALTQRDHVFRTRIRRAQGLSPIPPAATCS